MGGGVQAVHGVHPDARRGAVEKVALLHVQHQDAVGLHQCGHPVGDEDDGGVRHALLQRGADPGVRLRIHGGQRIVEHHHRRVLQQHPGDGHPLLLSAGQGNPPLAHHRVPALGQLRDGLVHAGGLGAGAQLLLRGVRPCGGDVLPDGLGEQEGLQADLAAQLLPGNIPDVRPADGDPPLPLSQVVQAVQQVDQGGFARPSAPQDGEGGPPGDGEGHVPEDLLPLVAEGDVVEHDIAGQAGGLGLRTVLLLAGLEDVAHPVQGHPGLAHVGQHPAQRPHRPRHGAVVDDEGLEIAQGQPAVHRLHRPGHDHRHHLGGGEEGP